MGEGGAELAHLRLGLTRSLDRRRPPRLLREVGRVRVRVGVRARVGVRVRVRVRGRARVRVRVRARVSAGLG